MGNSAFIKVHKERILILILVVAPFLYLMPYVFPFGFSGFDISVGNDFRILYYNYKAYLLHFLSRLELPYWSPSEASGYSFLFSPFTQFFYPLNILLTVFYKLAGGYSSVDHVRYTALAFSIFSAGLYKWMRTLNINILPAFITALLITSSVGSLEILRFPNAIHTLCWFPWVLFAMNRIFASDRKSSYFKYSLLLFFCLVCAVTAGYPYYLYYSVFIFVPYFLFFLFKYTRTNILKLEINNIVAPAVIIAVTLVITFLLCYPYLHSVSDLMNQTNGRGGSNYEYSTATSESPLSTLGSLIYPPLSSINTSFYLGLLNLFVILIYFINSGRGTGDRKKWIILIWISLLVFVTYGSGSFLFNFLWNYFPFFSNLREWGRLNKVILVLFAWLLGLSYNDFFKRIKENNLLLGKQEIILLIVSALIIALNAFFSVFKITSVEWQEYFVISKVDMLLQFSPQYAVILKSVLSLYGFVFLVSSVFVFFSLLKLFKYNKLQILPSKYKTIIVFILVFTFLESYTFAPWIWIKAEKSRSREQLTLDNKTAFGTQRTFLYKTVSLNSNFNSGVVADWYYSSYTEFLKMHSYDTLSLNKLLGLNTGKKLFFSSEINYKDIKSYLADADSSVSEIIVIDYSGNSLDITVNSNTEGYVSFIDNCDDKWKVIVNNNPESIYKLFNTFKSVHINKGNNNIRFFYKPF